MPDREIVAYVLLGCALIWIMWMDVRPVIKGWRYKDQRYKPSFILAGYLHCATRFITRSSDRQKSHFYLNTFYIPVGNEPNDRRTLRHAQARIFLHGDAVIIPVLGAKAGQVDIRHGEWAYFEIGRIVSENDAKRINHSIAFHDEDACTNQAESFFSRMRRAEIGQHHSISRHLGQYASEMAWREDNRRKPNGTLYLNAMGAALGHPVSRAWAGYWQRYGY